MPALPMDRCKRRLATLWFSGAGLVFFIFLFQTLGGHYRENVQEAWGWLLPTIMPTLSLIVSILVMDALGKGVPTQVVDSFLFRLAFALSAAYLAVVLLTILVQPISELTSVELMRQSNLWLGPHQGLACASIGAFFVKKG